MKNFQDFLLILLLLFWAWWGLSGCAFNPQRIVPKPHPWECHEAIHMESYSRNDCVLQHA